MSKDDFFKNKFRHSLSHCRRNIDVLLQNELLDCVSVIDVAGKKISIKKLLTQNKQYLEAMEILLTVREKP